MPAIARDGVNFCWLARDLAQHGVAALRFEHFQQHPLFPMLIVALQQIFRAAGAPDSPLTWQAAGQTVAMLSGIAVVVLAGRLAYRIHAQTAPDAPSGGVAAAASGLLLMSVLPLAVALSVDVMSDLLHLALYLAAVLVLLRLDSAPRAVALGLLASLAFLTRPEGATPALVGGALLLTTARTRPVRRTLAMLAALSIPALVLLIPYWIACGSLSPKLDKQTVHALSELTPALAIASPNAAEARLSRDIVPWYAAAPRAAYEAFRAGRVVVPLLAFATLVVLRRHLLTSLAGVTGCAATHFLLISLLIYRHGYLDPRHTLVLTALAIPFAALALLRVVCSLRRIHQPAIAGAILAPLAIYAARVPNDQTAHLREAANWLINAEPAPETKILVGGASERRIAFYANMPFQPWDENQPAGDPRFEALRHQILDAQPPYQPAYLAIEVGDGDERAQNRELLARFLADTPAKHCAELAARFPARRGDLVIYRFDWRRLHGP